MHLDFHTSPFIPDVGCEFDARQFARTMKEAHVNSVTIFAKCHHGQCYYPTKTGVQHPALAGRDLLGEQIEALHAAGIRCPIYTTVVWEEDVAQKHPEWRQLTKQGTFAGWTTSANQVDVQPGIWKFNNFLHPDYQDYIEAHVREICANYEVDGIFFDILFLAPGACWSEPSVEFRRKHNLLGDDQATFVRFQGAAQAAFARKFMKLVRGLTPKATVFYNAGNDSNIDPGAGPRARLNEMTHCEIESLPSGVWGYYHFPRMARMQSHWGKFWLGMTGRFQKMWGDFGGIKPQAALEFECFRSQALGGGNSIGDQLPPRGTLDPAAYELIGAVYKQCAEAEPFYEGSRGLPQIGVLSASYPGIDENTAGRSEEGAVQMCEESHYDAAVCDSLSDFSGLDLLILPDTTVIIPKLRKKLADFYASGGNLILSYRAGFDQDGKWALDFLPLEFSGEVEKFPTYWRVRKDFDERLSRSDRVFYQQGMNVTGGKGVRALVDRVLPYFKRTDATFSSHFQTPPVAVADEFPAVVAGKRFVYFADPIFREYRQSGNMAARDIWKRVAEQLIGRPAFGFGLPGTVLVYPRRRKQDLLLTLLHYIPVRKAIDIDIIEERSSFAGELLRVSGKASAARIFRGKKLVKNAEGAFVLPPAKGRLLIEIPGYF
ncbi:hypothetical protein ES708_13002 [subsurface metagenome]